MAKYFKRNLTHIQCSVPDIGLSSTSLVDYVIALCRILKNTDYESAPFIVFPDVATTRNSNSSL